MTTALVHARAVSVGVLMGLTAMVLLVFASSLAGGELSQGAEYTFLALGCVCASAGAVRFHRDHSLVAGAFAAAATLAAAWLVTWFLIEVVINFPDDFETSF